LTLVEVLNEADCERVQSFFEGQRDAVYGAGAGELGRRQLQVQFESAAREAKARRVSEGSDPLEIDDLTNKWRDWAAQEPRPHEPDLPEAKVHERPAGQARAIRIIVWTIMILILIGWLIAVITGAGGNCNSNCDAGGLGTKSSANQPGFVPDSWAVVSKRQLMSSRSVIGDPLTAVPTIASLHPD
jgi:hypothetical protein